MYKTKHDINIMADDLVVFVFCAISLFLRDGWFWRGASVKTKSTTMAHDNVYDLKLPEGEYPSLIRSSDIELNLSGKIFSR